MVSESLWNYYRDEIDDVDDNSSDGKLFEYITKLLEKTPQRPGNEGEANSLTLSTLNIEVTIPFKYHSIILFFNISGFAIDILWNRTWFIIDKRSCVKTEQNNYLTGINFAITCTELNVPVVTLFINDNTEFLEDIKQEFKTAITWNKYRSEITTQQKSNDLDYLIDLTFRNTNRLFVVSFKNGNDDPTSDSSLLLIGRNQRF